MFRNQRPRGRKGGVLFLSFAGARGQEPLQRHCGCRQPSEESTLLVIINNQKESFDIRRKKRTILRLFHASCHLLSVVI